MALECSQDAVLDFLKERGGKSVFPEDPQKKAAVRNRFKMYVDTVAYVKTEDGVKCVCLKKKFRGSLKAAERQPAASQVSGDDAAEEPAPHAPGSGFGSDSQVRLPRVSSPESSLPDTAGDSGESEGSDCVSSPQVRRSMVFRGSVHLSCRSDSDSASLTSGPDDDRTSLTLDPLEHEWMMCASDCEWSRLFPLLATEPSLVLRKDFITGFTCLHWAAKHGKPDVPISVDARSNTGYTPLHVAAMHNHMEVVKLLVGAYGADVEIRDYSGRKACQYLTNSVSMDIRDIIGAYDSRSNSEDQTHSEGARWRFSKVLQTNLKPLRRLQLEDADCVDGEDRPPRQKPLRRKSSLSKMRPRLQRLRDRTSQILHSTSFRDSDELETSTRASFRSRPKTHFFG
uniref:Sosondowah ankyrin repeat domain family Cb n=1 Tax=Labrus bergylta TaxID=56723 RepID=A0A3Q3FW01_9LABR